MSIELGKDSIDIGIVVCTRGRTDGIVMSSDHDDLVWKLLARELYFNIANAMGLTFTIEPSIQIKVQEVDFMT